MKIFTWIKNIYTRIFSKKQQVEQLAVPEKILEKNTVTLYDKMQELRATIVVVAQVRAEEAEGFNKRLDSLMEQYLRLKASYNASMLPNTMAVEIDPETDKNLLRLYRILEREITTFKENVVVYEVANQRLEVFIIKLNKIVRALFKKKNLCIVEGLISEAKEQFVKIVNVDINSIKSYEIQKELLDKINTAQYLILKIQIMYYNTGEIESYFNKNMSMESMAVEVLKDLDNTLKDSEIIESPMKQKIEKDIRRLKQFNYYAVSKNALLDKTYWLDVILVQQLVFDIINKKEKSKSKKVEKSMEQLNELVSVIKLGAGEFSYTNEIIKSLNMLKQDMIVNLLKDIILNADNLKVIDIYKFISLIGKREEVLNLEDKNVFLDEFFKIHMQYLSKNKLTDKEIEEYKEEVMKDKKNKKEYTRLCKFNEKLLEELKEQNLDVIEEKNLICINKRLIQSISSVMKNL